MLPSPPAQVPELQDTKGKRPGSPLAKEKDYHETMGKGPPPPLAEDLHLNPSTKQPELLPSTDRAPSTKKPVYESAKDSSSSGFLFLGRKFRTSIRMLVDNCLNLFNHSERRLWWMNPARIIRPQYQKFLVVIKNLITMNSSMESRLL
jgi:hypothetical protein